MSNDKVLSREELAKYNKVVIEKSNRNQIKIVYDNNYPLMTEDGTRIHSIRKSGIERNLRYIKIQFMAKDKDNSKYISIMVPQNFKLEKIEEALKGARGIGVIKPLDKRKNSKK